MCLIFRGFPLLTKLALPLRTDGFAASPLTSSWGRVRRYFCCTRTWVLSNPPTQEGFPRFGPLLVEVVGLGRAPDGGDGTLPPTGVALSAAALCRGGLDFRVPPPIWGGRGAAPSGGGTGRECGRGSPLEGATQSEAACGDFTW